MTINEELDEKERLVREAAMICYTPQLTLSATATAYVTGHKLKKVPVSNKDLRWVRILICYNQLSFL